MISKRTGENMQPLTNPNVWGPILGIGGMALGVYIGLHIGQDEGDVTRFKTSDCTEYTFNVGDRADNVAQELGANRSGEVSQAIHQTLDDNGYGQIEVCHRGSRWVVIDLDD